MNKTIKKLFSALVLLLVIFSAVAGQGSGVAYAAKQAEGSPEAPLAPGFTWDNLGQTTRSITLNIKGDALSLSGETFQAAERFTGGVPQEISSFYSNEQLYRAGWISDNSFETAEGLHQVFTNEAGVYLAVDFVKCADDAGLTCVSVWLSEPAANGQVVAGPELPAASIEPLASTWSKTAPVDGATVTTPTNVTLAWGAYSPTPDKYSYCIKANEPCLDNAPEWTGTFTSTSVNMSLAAGVKYYWQVKAITCITCTPKTVVYANNETWWNFTTTSNTISGSAGVAGVTLTYSDGGTKTVTSDASGNYVISPSYNWSGTVVPSKTGYTFSPVSRPYSMLKTNQTGQNYTAMQTVITISGNAGTPGAVFSYWDGTAKTATADGTGAYTINVSYGWSGMVTPSKSCKAFTPASVTYSNLTMNQTNFNYTAAPAIVTITGNTGPGMVSLDYIDGGALTVYSNSSGDYSLTASCPFTGKVTPSKAGYSFTPASKTYTAVALSKAGQNYTANVTISGNAGVGAGVGYMLNGSYLIVVTDGGGAYQLTVPYNWSGILTPSKAGFIFSPTTITLTNVIAAQTGKDFSQFAGLNIAGSLGVEGAGAALNYTSGGTAQTAYADGSGNYSLSVTDPFTGVVTPSRAGWVFTPANRSYTGISANQTAQNYTAVKAATFGDVPVAFWAWQHIEILVKNGITAGCSTPPMNYCPTAIVTRDQMAVFLVKAKHGSSFVPPNATGVFADVPTTHWAAKYIEQLAADGITGGCSATPKNYCPSSPVTRDQMAVFLLKAKYSSSYVPPTGSGVFADVSTNYWAGSYIEQLSAEGITAGCSVSPKNYCPVSSVTRDAMAVFLVTTFWLK